MSTATNEDVKQIDVPDGTLTYNDDSHSYNLDGVEIPSSSDITGVLDTSGPLLGWLSKEMCSALREKLQPDTKYDSGEIDDIIEYARKARWRSSGKALNIGSAAHAWFERHIKDKLSGGEGLADDLPDREPVLEAVVEFLEWESEEVNEWLRSEEIVAIPANGFYVGGTFDALADTTEGLLVVDFKTSKSIYDSHLLQGAGYWKGVKYSYGQHPDGFCILRTPKDEADVEPHIVTDDAEVSKHADGFECAHGLYRWRETNGI
jgi:hypothetical protein